MYYFLINWFFLSLGTYMCCEVSYPGLIGTVRGSAYLYSQWNIKTFFSGFEKNFSLCKQGPKNYEF